MSVYWHSKFCYAPPNGCFHFTATNMTTAGLEVELLGPRCGNTQTDFNPCDTSTYEGRDACAMWVQLAGCDGKWSDVCPNDHPQGAVYNGVAISTACSSQCGVPEVNDYKSQVTSHKLPATMGM